MNVVETIIGPVNEADLAVQFAEIDDADQFARVTRIVHVPTGKVVQEQTQVAFRKVNSFENYWPAEITVEGAPETEITSREVSLDGKNWCNALDAARITMEGDHWPYRRQWMPTSKLERKLSLQDDPGSFASILEYLHNGKVVHRSANVCIKRTPDMASAMGQIG